MAPQFVHLHNHSMYSLLDGLSPVKQMVARAKELEMPALALTDHGTMFGAIDFYRACKAADIKPIIGVESYLARRTMEDRDSKKDARPFHLLLLAENQTGYQNLLKIASDSQLEGFYYKPRIDHDYLASHAKGLICTTGCMAAEVPRALAKGDHTGARKLMDFYYDVFGRENFFIELQDHDIPELRTLNKALLELGPRYNARYVATNDVHYVNAEDYELQDVLLCIQTSSLLSDDKRMRMTDNSYYMRTPLEMEKLFGHVPGALSNTVMIAERCNVNLDTEGYQLPKFDVPKGYDAQSYLRHLCEQGLRQRFGTDAGRADIRQRLDYELGIINKMGFDTYFLIVWDMCKFAAREGIWYNARGSAAGSLVAYSLFITLVDPLEHKLIFERFLNPGRISMPDIDLDFQDDRRMEMLEYTAHKYGEDNVAQIITFGTLKARAALRDVGRVMDIPLNTVDRIAKMVPNVPGPASTIGGALEEVAEFKEIHDSDPEIGKMIDTAHQLEGVVRNAGTHAAGVIVTPEPVVNFIPLHRPTSNADTSVIKAVTQFPMEVLDSLGLLKVDFLGLRTLTIMARACDLIRERHNIDLDINSIPTDDPAIFDLLGKGDVDGVFQVEGAGMRRFLVEMKPQRLDHVIAMVALYRPGPLEFIPNYIDRMHGKEEVTYRHPLQEPILSETYGITVYQEQIMYTAMELGGYTASEADFLRKTVAKKKEKELIKQRGRFVSGARKNGIDKQTADAIFDDWEAFARYGFPKGHAADYAVITCQTAYLKAHYPVEYMTALLSAESGDTAKVSQYALDTQRMGIDVLPPNVNFSGWNFTVQDFDDAPPAIRFGLGAIKNVGEGPVEEIKRARQDGPFKDLSDFCTRADLRKVGKRALECLIKAGALDDFGERWALYHSLDQISGVSISHHKAQDVGQFDMFSMLGGDTAAVNVQIKNITPLAADRREMKKWEKELVGLYVSGHPLQEKWPIVRHQISMQSGDMSEDFHGQQVTIAGVLTEIRAHLTAKGKSMGFATLEDIQGTFSLVIFPRTWSEMRDTLNTDELVLVRGKVDDSGKILVDQITTEFEQIRPAIDQIPIAPPPEPAPVKLTPRPAQPAPPPPPEPPTATDQPANEDDDTAEDLAEIPDLPPGWDEIPDFWDDVPAIIGTPPPPPVFMDEEGEIVAAPVDFPAVDENTLPEAPPDDDFWEPMPGQMAEPPAPYVPGAALAAARTASEAERTPEFRRASRAEIRNGRTPLGKPGTVASTAGNQRKKIILTLRPTYDLFESYKLRLKWAYNTFIKFPGEDQFAIIVAESDGRVFELDFFETTGYCEKLEKLLLEIVHTADCIDIQPILV